MKLRVQVPTSKVNQEPNHGVEPTREDARGSRQLLGSEKRVAMKRLFLILGLFGVNDWKVRYR